MPKSVTAGDAIVRRVWGKYMYVFGIERLHELLSCSVLRKKGMFYKKIFSDWNNKLYTVMDAVFN